MTKEKADKLIDDLLAADFTVTAVMNPAGDTIDRTGDSGPWANVWVGSLTLRHHQIMRAAAIAQKHGCELHMSSFGKAGDIGIITQEEAKHLFPAHHRPPPGI